MVDGIGYALVTAVGIAVRLGRQVPWRVGGVGGARTRARRLVCPGGLVDIGLVRLESSGGFGGRYGNAQNLQ